MSPSRDDHVANASESSGDGPTELESEREKRPKPLRTTESGNERPDSAGEWAHWVLAVDHGPVMWARELAISAGAVLLIGLLLFALSGVWPPMVAVESGSMEPHMQKGDLVFVAAADRYASDAAFEDTGVVPSERGAEVAYQKFGDYGDVIIFKPNGGDDTPIIHRAHFWVTEGENWYDRADPAYIGGATSCEELRNCPSPHDGFITRGDDNSGYDQVQGQSDPVKEEWVIATARVRVPWLGWIRLYVSELAIGPTVLVELAPDAHLLDGSDLSTGESERGTLPPVPAAS